MGQWQLCHGAPWSWIAYDGTEQSHGIMQGVQGRAAWVCRREVLGVPWPSSTVLPPQPPQHCSQPRTAGAAAVAPYLWLCFPELNSTKCDNQN